MLGNKAMIFYELMTLSIVMINCDGFQQMKVSPLTLRRNDDIMAHPGDFRTPWFK